LIFSLSNDSPVSVKIFVAILLIAAVPAYAQAQSRSTPKVTKGDAQKVMTIISGDKIKTQAYCDIQKLAEQVAEANEKKDVERVNELFEKIETLEKTIGLEYVALIDGVQDIAKNEQLRAEFCRHLERSPGCVRGKVLENPNAPAATRAIDGTF
jgi:flagellar motility protein MotE (MotC chaperone)